MAISPPDSTMTCETLFSALDRFITEAAPSDRPGLVVGPGRPGKHTPAPTSLRGAVTVELAAGRDGCTPNGVTATIVLVKGAAGRGDAEACRLRPETGCEG